MPLPEPLIKLIEELQRLPGIGPKGAQRLAFYILRTPREQTDRLLERDQSYDGKSQANIT